MNRLTIRIWRQWRMWQWEVDRGAIPVAGGNGENFSDVVVRAQRCYLETLMQYRDDTDATNEETSQMAKYKKGSVVVTISDGRVWGVVRVSKQTGSLTLQPTGGRPFKFTDSIVVAPYEVKPYR